MKITVHRGLNEIGGTCIELAHEDYRIVLDLGIPLTQTGGGEVDEQVLNAPSIANGLLPDISGLYKSDLPTINAVLLSHAHMDHYGLMDFINPDIPVFLSNDARAIIEVGNVFWGKKMQQEHLLNHCNTFAYWEKFNIGPFAITPYLVDHSAYGSTAFLIETEDRKVFYTGDFRAHGNKSVTYRKLLKDASLKCIDALLIEGTTLGGDHKGSLASEADVDTQMTDVFKQQQDVSFVIASGSNIDRLVTLFKATRRANKELVVDLYQYYLLCKLKAANPNSKLPPFDDDHIRIYYTSSQAQKIVDHLGKTVLFEYKKKKISRDEIIERRKDLVLRLSLFEMERLANKMNDESPLDKTVLIYSMWSGYLKKDSSFSNFCNKFNIPMQHIHSSGHAYKEDILKLANAIQPKKLIPIHTLHAEVFEQELKNINVATDKIINI